MVPDGLANVQRHDDVVEAEEREQLPDECILQGAGHREALNDREVTM